MKCKSRILTVTSLLAAFTWGCSSAPQNSGNSGKAANSDGSGTGTDTGGGTDAGGTGTDGTGGGQAGDGDFAGWCKAANQTNDGPKKLQDMLALLCDGDNPTDFFKATLVNTAYAGSGNPQLKTPPGGSGTITSDKGAKTTTALFGVGIKMPISAQQHFDTIGPKAGDPATQKLLASSQGATQSCMDIHPNKATDKFFTRGWKVHSCTSQTAAITTINLETVNDSDQYTFKKGSTYMIGQALEADDAGAQEFSGYKRQTVEAYEILTADMQVNGTGYLLSVAKITVDNLGLPAFAEPKIHDTAISIVKVMYQAAAGGGTGGGG